MTRGALVGRIRFLDTDRTVAPTAREAIFFIYVNWFIIFLVCTVLHYLYWLNRLPVRLAHTSRLQSGEVAHSTQQRPIYNKISLMNDRRNYRISAN